MNAGDGETQKIKPAMGLRAGGYEDAVVSNDPLVTFLYLLGRDELPLGVIERLVSDATLWRDAKFSNDFLAAYAIELSSRLSGTPDREAFEKSLAAIRAKTEYDK